MGGWVNQMLIEARGPALTRAIAVMATLWTTSGLPDMAFCDNFTFTASLNEQPDQIVITNAPYGETRYHLFAVDDDRDRHTDAEMGPNQPFITRFDDIAPHKSQG